MKDKYLCDPRKNVECTKEGCRWRHNPPFGDCFCTTKAEYAFDKVPEPISDHDYNVLEKSNDFTLVIHFSQLGDDINVKCFGEKPKGITPATFVHKKFDREDLEDI